MLQTDDTRHFGVILGTYEKAQVWPGRPLTTRQASARLAIEERSGRGGDTRRRFRKCLINPQGVAAQAYDPNLADFIFIAMLTMEFIGSGGELVAPSLDVMGFASAIKERFIKNEFVTSYERPEVPHRVRITVYFSTPLPQPGGEGLVTNVVLTNEDYPRGALIKGG